MNKFFKLCSNFLTGFLVNDIKVRAILLNAVFDAPARCLFQNMTQFNGFYGWGSLLPCPRQECPDKWKGSKFIHSTNGYHDARTLNSITMNAREAEERKANGIRQHSVLGVKGRTWFHYLQHFNIVCGVSVDYMHCVTNTWCCENDHVAVVW